MLQEEEVQNEENRNSFRHVRQSAEVELREVQLFFYDPANPLLLTHLLLYFPIYFLFPGVAKKEYQVLNFQNFFHLKRKIV
jgi:hypothetical protein